MSDFEGSDWDEMESGEEDMGTDSDCEDITLGDTGPEPAVTFGGAIHSYGPSEEVYSDEEVGEDDDDDYVPPSLDSVPDFEPLETESHTVQPRIPEGMDRTSPLAFFNSTPLLLIQMHMRTPKKQYLQLAIDTASFPGPLPMRKS